MHKIALVAAIMAGFAFPSMAEEAPSITGHWKSVTPEAAGPITATREFEIRKDTWSVVFRAFADAEASQPLFRIEVGGAYAIGGPSAKVSGAYEGIFPATRRDLTAESPAGVAMFAGMGCTLEEGLTKHLVNEGCGFLPSLMQAMGEYDLVALKDGQLFLGDRAGDLTKARPEKLTPFPLVRQ